MRKAQKTALVATFAALHSVLFLLEGPWRTFVIYLLPIEGIVLGPLLGLSAALLGSIVARLIEPSMWWMFGIISEPLGVVAAAFLAKGKWKEVTAVYGLMLGAYFVHPYGRALPLWTVLDLLVAFALIYPASRIGKWVWEKRALQFSAALLLIAFVSTAADSMARVFLLVPAGLHGFFALSYDALAYGWFIPGAVASYVEDLLVTVVTLAAGIPLLLSLRSILNLEKPLS